MFESRQWKWVSNNFDEYFSPTMSLILCPYSHPGVENFRSTSQFHAGDRASGDCKVEVRGQSKLIYKRKNPTYLVEVWTILYLYILTYIDHIGSYWFSPTLRNIIVNKMIIIPFHFPEVFCPPRVGVLAVRVLVRKGLDSSFFGDRFGWNISNGETLTDLTRISREKLSTSPAHHFKSVTCFNW